MNGQVEVVIGRATLNEPRYALSPLLPFRCPIDWTATDWTRTTPPPVVVVVVRGSVLKRKLRLKRKTVATSLWWRRTPWLVRADWPV